MGPHYIFKSNAVNMNKYFFNSSAKNFIIPITIDFKSYINRPPKFSDFLNTLLIAITKSRL